MRWSAYVLCMDDEATTLFSQVSEFGFILVLAGQMAGTAPFPVSDLVETKAREAIRLDEWVHLVSCVTLPLTEDTAADRDMVYATIPTLE
ncbi:hypothetical protein CEP53_013654 [Fusarium sp. AF-6]|nr:hypothetical protein CEP53_013654 [Fusarium sp. AF-6]